MPLILLLKLCFSYLISFLCTLYLVPIFADIAQKLKVLDIPDGVIKVHKRPTPYLGGVALYVGFIISLALSLPFESRITLFLVGSTLLLFVGLIDDIMQLKPYQKFFGQIIASLCFLKAGLYLKESFFLSNFWTIPGSLFWILTIINAFNLVDVMDGLATTIALCVSFILIVLAFIFNQYNLALLLATFLGALSSFFWYNKPTAQIYLGDAGSLFIGGFLGAIPFLFKWSTYNKFGYIIPFFVMIVPLLEIITLIVVRTYKKIPFYYGSPDHFSIYLQQGGWSKKKVLVFIAIFSVLFWPLCILFALNKISLSLFLLFSFINISLWFITIRKVLKQSIF